VVIRQTPLGAGHAAFLGLQNICLRGRICRCRTGGQKSRVCVRRGSFLTVLSFRHAQGSVSAANGNRWRTEVVAVHERNLGRWVCWWSCCFPFFGLNRPGGVPSPQQPMCSGKIAKGRGSQARRQRPHCKTSVG
jgi:hypothetical protein